MLVSINVCLCACLNVWLELPSTVSVRVWVCALRSYWRPNGVIEDEDDGDSGDSTTGHNLRRLLRLEDADDSFIITGGVQAEF